MYYRNSDGDMVEAPVEYQRSEYKPSDFDLKAIFLNGIKRVEYIPTKEMQQAHLDTTTIDAIITVFRLKHESIVAAGRVSHMSFTSLSPHMEPPTAYHHSASALITD
jgi:hypothetical protein